MSVKRTSLATRKIRAAWSGDEGRQAFTIVELLLVVIISMIILAGMVALISSVFTVFRTDKDLQALNDSWRRALASMSSQLRTALHFDNDNCTESTLTFWADIDSSTKLVDIYNYNTLAEKAQFLKNGSKVAEAVTQPGSTTPVTATLGSYVGTLKFFYFQQDVVPGGSDPTNPSGNFDPTEVDVNTDASMIRIVMKLQKGNVHHTYYQDVFLRIVVRPA